MAFNGSGVHNRVHDWTQDLTNAIPVTASRMDAEHNDISSSLTNTICRDGQSTTTARIPFASGVSAAAGTTASVAYAQTNDANTGVYFPATDQWGLVAGGAPTLSSTATKVTATVAVDFTGAIAPTSSDGAALGSGTQMWSDLFLASGGVINWNNGDVTISNFTANGLSFNGATGGYFFDAAVAPESDDGAPLGSTLLKWSDLHLAPGAVINFNDGDVTLTHSANTLMVAGGTLVAGDVTATGLTVGGNSVTGTLSTRQMLTSGTGATYATPVSARQLRIRMVGGGGGGGAAATNNGSDGTATVFNSIEAAGGSGGSNGTAKAGGNGGSGGAGSASIRVVGNPGENAGGAGSGGNGGSSTLGGSGRGGVNVAGSNAGNNSGSGGGGGALNGTGEAGGGGAGEYVELIINSPSSTYTYTVGGGGSAGSAGTRAGGTGGSGIIIVDEYY